MRSTSTPGGEIASSVHGLVEAALDRMETLHNRWVDAHDARQALAISCLRSRPDADSPPDVAHTCRQDLSEKLEDAGKREQCFRASQRLIEQENRLLKQDCKQEEQRRLRMIIWCRQRAISITCKFQACRSLKQALEHWQGHWLQEPKPARRGFFQCFGGVGSPRARARAYAPLVAGS